MIEQEIAFVREQFESVASLVREEVGRLHSRINIVHAALTAITHLVSSKESAMSAAMDALKSEVADLDGVIDQLITAKKEADAAAQAADDAAASDIRSSLDAIKNKVSAALGGSDASTGSTTDAGASSSTSASVTATVSAPTTAGATSIPVDQTSATAASTALGSAIQSGSTVSVSGSGIADGTTLQGVDNSTLTISQPTTADHAGDGTETVTVTPAA